MSVTSAISRVDEVGDDVTYQFPYTFKIFENTHMVVTVRNTSTQVETTLVEDTDYTLSGVGLATGGTVELMDAGQAWFLTGGGLKTAYVLTLRRLLPVTQEFADIRNQGAYHASLHEDAFDQLVHQNQQQQDDLSRTAKLPVTIDIANFDPELPADLVGNADRFLMTNSSGDGFAVGPSTTSIGAGDVVGPVSSVDNEMVLFDGTSGNSIKRASGIGVPVLTNGVSSVIAGTSGQYLKSNGAGTAPSFQTLTLPTIQRFSAGSGTYTTPANVKYIRVTLVGGGGGGGGSATTAASNAGNGTAGADSTFSIPASTTLITAPAGGLGQGNAGTAGFGGGSPTVTAPAVLVHSQSGGNGGKGAQMAVANTVCPGGEGGGSGLGRTNGASFGDAASGSAALPASGNGGAGANGPQSAASKAGCGGGAGTFVVAIIHNPLATYSYTVGASGNGGAAGTSGAAGGAGGSGTMIVEEFYQ